MEWLAKHSYRLSIVVIVLSFIAGAAIAIHSGPQLRYPDEREWTQLSVNLIKQHRYTFDGIRSTAIRPPGYAFFLALPTLTGVGNTGLRIINLSMFLCSEVFLYLLAKRMGSPFTAAIAMLLVFAYPILLYTATLLYPQTFGTALLLAAIWLLTGTEVLTVWKVLLAGCAWGTLILTIPAFVFLLGVFAIWLLWRRRGFRRKVVVFVAPLLILVGGWSLRDYVVFNSFVFVATNGGFNLLLGNSEKSTMNSGVYTDISKYSDRAEGMSEVDADRFYTASAKQWMREHPGAALRLNGAKCIQYFSYTERMVTQDFATSLEQPRWRRLIMLFTYEPLLFLFITRVVLARKFPLSEAEILLAGLYLVNALLSAAFVPRIRYRLPMDWLLLLVDAGMIQIIWSRLAARQSSENRESRAYARCNGKLGT